MGIVVSKKKPSSPPLVPGSLHNVRRSTAHRLGVDQMFNFKTGYAHPSNTYLAKQTGIAANKVQDTLTAMDRGGAIARVVIERPGEQDGELSSQPRP